MKVAMVTHSYPPDVHGGGEISCRLLVTALEEHGVDVDVLVGAKLFPGCSMLKSISRMYGLLKQKQSDYDIIHVYNMDYLPVAGRLTKKYGLKTVATLNGIKYSNQMLDESSRSLFRLFRNKFLINHYIKYISRFVTLCPMYMQMWVADGISEDRVTVIPNMMDPDFKIKREENYDFTTLFVGNKAWWRDGRTVEEVSEYTKSHVIAVGNGWDFSEDIESIASDYGTNDIKNIYAVADVLIAPYKLPLPISRCIIEAMQSGLPVVTTGSDTFSPIITNEHSGFLTENNNFSNVVNRLQADRELYNRISKNAKETVNTVCHPDTISKQYIKIYNRLIGEYND